jgi:hypothetical protein
MVTKAELIQRLEELNALEDAEQAAEKVEGVKEAYESIVAQALQAVHAGDDGAPAGEALEDAPVLAIESAPLQDEEDKRFKQLLDAFNQRVNDIRRRKTKEEADNMAAKKAIMEELQALIANEENISSAFNRFNELHEKWRSIGPVPGQHYRELQTDYSHLRDEFFYHIRIYKELRDHDLRKNTALKQALVSDMQSLSLKDNIRELEQMVREYQEKWQQIGPVVREEWEAIRDGFWNATRVVYDKVHEHYRARRSEHEANLAAKQGLIDKVTALLERTAAAGTKEWKQLTEEVLELQNAWKQIGFATKKDNERIWKEFRNACNTFFNAKKSHFDSLRDQFRAARERKQALLEEALALKDSTEWKRTADRLKSLQQQWKEAGSAGPRDENKLWGRFREACDAFFQNRKTTFAKQDEEQAASAQEKEVLLTEIEAFQLSGERNRDLTTLKEFSMRWMNSGRVSPRLFDSLNERYRAALDKHYGQLKMEGDERRRVQFQDHVESLKSAPDGRDRMERESRFVKRRIEELQTEVRQMEQNMGMFNFKSASGEAMRKEMEKKIERLGREVERLQGQHKELLKELR